MHWPTLQFPLPNTLEETAIIKTSQIFHKGMEILTSTNNYISQCQVSLSWRSPIDEGGAPVSGYVIQRRDTKRDTWLDVATIDDVSTTTMAVSHVIEGESYHFQVMAVNKEGRGDPVQSQMVTVANPYRYVNKQQLKCT